MSLSRSELNATIVGVWVVQVIKKEINFKPEQKENYTQGTASTSFPGPLYCCDYINTQWFDGIRLAPGERSSHSHTTVQ